MSGSRTTVRKTTTTGTGPSGHTVLTHKNVHYTLLSFDLVLFFRWNSQSEHLQRKTYRTGRTGSLDELEEFAASSNQRRCRGPEKKQEEHGDYEMEFVQLNRYPSYRNGPPQHYHSDENELEDNREDYSRRNKKIKHSISPLPSPKKRSRTWDGEHPVPPPPRVGASSTSTQDDYDGTFLNSLLERKAKLRLVSQGKNAARGEEDSDTPSKGSSQKSSGESNRNCSRSPSNRPEADSLPPYSDTERSRTNRASPRPLPTKTRSSQPPSDSLPGLREESRDKSRKVVS